ncbi:MAG: type II toxin-antitoxin system RelE/ParE family toxin [Candidatus Neomarinimicrobiota bacterium]
MGIQKGLKEKTSELKFDFGPGYRIYFSLRNDTIVLLLCAGDKGSQKRDIKKARNILNEWESQNE